MHKNKPVNFAPAKQQKCENAPGKARKRRNRVRFGCWRGWQRLGTDKTRCEKPKFEPKRTPFPCTTCKKKPGRNTVFPPGLWQGQKDLVSPAASGAAPRWGAPSTDRGGSRDRFAAERHWRSLTPRHAVLEWMWESTAESGRGTVLPGSRRKSQNRRCWFGAARKFRAQKGGKNPEKQEIR